MRDSFQALTAPDVASLIRGYGTEPYFVSANAFSFRKKSFMIGLRST